MIKLLWRTDVHASDKTPFYRKGDWIEIVEDKLIQVAKIAQKEKVDYILDGGDFFDKKSPSRNSHDLVRRMAEVHTNHYTKPVYCCVGNHDCRLGNIEFLPQQPLGVLFSSGVFKRLYDEHELIVEKNGVKVRVVGVPYHGSKYDLNRLDVKKKDEDYLVLVCHLYATKNPLTFYEGEDILSYETLNNFEADVFCFGHWHKDQGIEEFNNKLIVNVGSLTRGTLSEDNQDRNPCVVSLEFTKEKINHKRINLKAKKLDEAFFVEKKKETTNRKIHVDSFIESLKALHTEVNDTIENKISKSTDIKQNVKTKALEILEEIHD